MFELDYCIPGQISPEKVAEIFSCAITEKLFDLDLSNLVCGYIWRILTSSSNLGLDLQIIGQLRPLKGQILGFFALFGPVLEKGRAYDLKDHKYKAYICPL